MNFKDSNVTFNRFPLAVILFVISLFTIGLWSCNSSNNENNPAHISYYVQSNLVSDQASQGAAHVDTNLVNPWGIAYGPPTYFWIANNHSGNSTVYDGNGTNPIGLVVTIPPPEGSPPETVAAPTGVVYNGSATDFQGDKFIFDSEDGTISGWQTGTSATLRTSVPDAVYKGLATGTNTAGDLLLYATNFAAGTVDVFDTTYMKVSLTADAFKDPQLPDGFNPFGIQNIDGEIYVSFAERIPPSTDETHGTGLGYVSIFSTDGAFIKRFASQGTLNAPWGLAKAPANFGPVSGALLVGNFGDGHVNAFDYASGMPFGPLWDSGLSPITIDGLWGLIFGNNALAGSSNVLYFTAGVDDESHGLFGTVNFVP